MPRAERPDNDLDRIKNYLVEASTPDWHVVPLGGHAIKTFYKVVRFDGKEVMRAWKEEDAEFVVAARNDIPKLIKELEWLRDYAEEGDGLLAIYDRADEPTISFEEAIAKMEDEDAE